MVYTYLSTTPVTAPTPPPQRHSNAYGQTEKQGWIRLSTRHKPKATDTHKLMTNLQSYIGPLGKRRGLVYGVLKHGALFIYESSDQQACRIILPLHDYTVSIYPPKKAEGELYGRTSSIQLSLKEQASTKESTQHPHPQEEGAPPKEIDYSYLLGCDLYLVCERASDKEDWLLALTAACEMMSDTPNKAHIETMDYTEFDPSAMQSLISTVYQSKSHCEMQWLNAVLGRVFLGVYKTQEIRRRCEEMITNKSKKAQLPSFLGDIQVRSVDLGHSIPYITNPKLLSISPEGELLAEAHVDYSGGMCVVVETDLTASYSSLMKPFRVRLVLSVQLKQLVGKCVIKIKPPPSNRFWIGFCETPLMSWAITPEVSDKQIKLSMVTNAIESRIREYMVENMVLPNMDDFPFSFSHGKGGIFGEKVPKPSDGSESTPLPCVSAMKDSPAIEPVAVVNHVQVDPGQSATLQGLQGESVEISQSIKGSKRPCSSLYSTAIITAAATAVAAASDYTNIRLQTISQSTHETTLHEPTCHELKDKHELSIPCNRISQESSLLIETSPSTNTATTITATTSFEQDVCWTTDTPPIVPDLHEIPPLHLTHTVSSSFSASSSPPPYIAPLPVDPQGRWPVSMAFRKRPCKPKQENVALIEEHHEALDERHDADDTSSLLSSHSFNKRSLLNKIGNFNTESAGKALSNKKSALYTVAGTLFHKGATRDVRKKRNQEMQELHARKMNAFASRVADMQRRCSHEGTLTVGEPPFYSMADKADTIDQGNQGEEELVEGVNRTHSSSWAPPLPPRTKEYEGIRSLQDASFLLETEAMGCSPAQAFPSNVATASH
ncbi:putative integral membrane protein conserved region-domain-containing protein [Spinellus fusiger]|nr:putative integral membrane protein conserved region-domain-containing protein [Spinellus fusiger]